MITLHNSDNGQTAEIYKSASNSYSVMRIVDCFEHIEMLGPYKDFETAKAEACRKIGLPVDRSGRA